MYSKDFREKIINTYNTGDYSYRNLCEKFDVSLDFVQNLIQNYKKTGSLFNLNKKKTRVSKINGDTEIILKELIKNNPSITLKEICIYFKENHDFIIGKSSVDRKLKALKISVKKNGTIIQRKIQKNID